MIVALNRYELGFNETVCDNLNVDESLEEQQNEVQRLTNDVQLVMVGQYTVVCILSISVLV